MRNGWTNLKKIETDLICSCGFQKPVSLSFSKVNFLVCNVCYNAFETLLAVIFSFTSNFSSSIANAYKAVGIINNLN